MDMLLNLAGVGIGGAFKGILPKKGVVESLESYLPFKIGQGSESIVVRNTPTTVGKITQCTRNLLKRTIPNSAKTDIVGEVEYNGQRLPMLVQEKLKTITEKQFPKYAEKLDKLMERAGYKRIHDPAV